MKKECVREARDVFVKRSQGVCKKWREYSLATYCPRTTQFRRGAVKKSSLYGGTDREASATFLTSSHSLVVVLSCRRIHAILLPVPPAIPTWHGCRLYKRARATTCSLLSLPHAAQGAPCNPSPGCVPLARFGRPTCVIFFSAFAVAAG